MPTEYRAPDGDFSWVTLAQLAGELGRTPFQTRKLIHKLRYAGIERKWQGNNVLYRVDDLEALKSLLGQTDRPTPPSQDWLTTYLGGTPHA